VSLSGNQRQVYRAPGGVRLHDIAPDGRMLVSHNDQRTAVATTDRDGKERDLSWLDESGDPSISDDGLIVEFIDWSIAGGPAYSVCLRKLDGTPVTRLGNGAGVHISHDGKSVLVHDVVSDQLVVMPTGAGQSHQVDQGNLTGYLMEGSWLHDNQHVVCSRAWTAGSSFCARHQPRRSASTRPGRLYRRPGRSES
jgi:hypothetical protein